MGSSSSHPPAPSPTYTPDLTNFQIIGQGDTYNIWRNHLTGTELQQYTSSTASAKDLQYLLSVFTFRYNSPYLVSSIYYKDNTSQELCSTFYNASIFLERIPLRLNEINDLPYPDNLHLVRNCLEGFRELYERVGSFEVTERAIGVNMEAEVKVWIAGDFGRDRVSFYGEERRGDEVGMVREIMAVVDKVVDHRTEPEPLSAFVMRGGGVTFREALARVQEYVGKYNVQVPNCLRSVADLRDRGFFKKMPPSRKTRFIGQSVTSLGSTNNQMSIRFDDLVGPSVRNTTVGGLDTISPVIAAGTLSNIPVSSAQQIGNLGTVVQRQATTTVGGPTSIQGIPVIQNPNSRVNTFYSNTPVGGSYPISRSPIRGVSPLTGQKKITTNIITNNNSSTLQHPPARPLTPTFQPTLPPPPATTLTPRAGSHYLHHHNRFPLPQASPIIPVPPTQTTTTVKSIHSEKSLPTQVQNLLKQINDINNQPSLTPDIATQSGYISHYTPNADLRSSFDQYYNSVTDPALFSQTPIYRSYEPTDQGFTNPELLRLANIQRTVQTSYNEFVNTSYNPTPTTPLYTSTPETFTSQYDDFTTTHHQQISPTKSILKNRYEDTADFGGVQRSIINDFKSEFQSQILPDKPIEEEQARTIVNRNEFRDMQEVRYTKQVETYRANIKVLTPEELKARRIVHI